MSEITVSWFAAATPTQNRHSSAQAVLVRKTAAKAARRIMAAKIPVFRSLRWNG
jgi:hypothetical protein